MNIADFDYPLPEELIAQKPMNPREAANLMVIHRETHTIEHKKVADFPTLLHPSDILVLNNTKVFKARLQATIQRTNLPDRTGELFLVRPSQSHLQEDLLQMLPGQSIWLAIGKPGKAFSVGASITVASDFVGQIKQQNSDGSFLIFFSYSVEEVIAKANIYGSVPLLI